MPVTISTHNGTAVAREHNIRNEKVVSKERHIDPNGIHETWIDEPIRQAYERLFGESVLNYNNKQTRADRKIDSYYNTICKDKKKHPVYEMIIGVYGKSEDGSPICSSEQGKAIMQKFVEDWSKRNPNLELIGAYYHADEDGEPHVHLDYVPVAHGYTRGMETQTGLVKALGEQGFEKNGRATAQIQWEKRENDYLTSLCEDIGLTVIHPQIEGRKHIETQTFKLQKQIEELRTETAKLKNAHSEDLLEKSKFLKGIMEKATGGKRLTKDEIARIENIAAVVEEFQKYTASAKEVIKVAKNREKAADNLIINANEQIRKQVEELTEKGIAAALQGTVTDRTKRLETYCRQTKLPNGRNMLDEFEQAEERLRQQTIEKARKQQENAPLFSYEKIMNDFKPTSDKQHTKKKTQERDI
ncbi:MAG: plasmid recombination protein [Prevotella sp.]|nr:plasmid recombination protein [Alistipes senegalensis]MCM1358162.1 plasmid recombination protein [Prevotella sp.]MCM1474057.1 plasmid recombination protein [Muribaculaceae bacterium]